jgi:CheY-like chemotaxis protein
VLVGVTDTGAGMSEQVKQHLFEPFFTTKGPDRGTGLGLATTYGIVQQCAGAIEVTSELGCGTSFQIYLPVAPPGQAAEAVPTPGPARIQGGETVLVVEDQDAVRQLVELVLDGYGYQVLTAASGPEALERAAEFSGRIHLLLTDVILPGMNGREVSEALVAARPGLKVLYMSGHSEETIGHRGVLDSGLAYLSKPFSPEELAVKVREQLGAGGPGQRAAGSSGG